VIADRNKKATHEPAWRGKGTDPEGKYRKPRMRNHPVKDGGSNRAKERFNPKDFSDAVVFARSIIHL